MHRETMRQIIAQSTAASVLAATTTAVAGIDPISTSLGFVGNDMELRRPVNLGNDNRYWVSGTVQSADYGIAVIGPVSVRLETAMMELTENLLNSEITVDADCERLLYENIGNLY